MRDRRSGRANYLEPCFPNAQTVVDVQEIFGVPLIETEMAAPGHVDHYDRAAESLNPARAGRRFEDMSVLTRIVRAHYDTRIGQLPRPISLPRPLHPHCP